MNNHFFEQLMAGVDCVELPDGKMVGYYFNRSEFPIIQLEAINYATTPSGSRMSFTITGYRSVEDATAKRHGRQFCFQQIPPAADSAASDDTYLIITRNEFDG